MTGPSYLRVAFIVVIISCSASVVAQRPARPNSLRTPDKLREGDQAPDFTLNMMDGDETVTLSSFHGDRPVALVFGSYT